MQSFIGEEGSFADLCAGNCSLLGRLMSYESRLIYSIESILDDAVMQFIANGRDFRAHNCVRFARDKYF